MSDQLVIDDWEDRGVIETGNTINLTEGQRYPVTMEFYENTGMAAESLFWSHPDQPEVNGLYAEYFDNSDLTGLTLTRIDSTVDFNWGANSPSPSWVHNYSVRWTGEVMPEFTETYTFYTYTDDGVRLWVNGQLLIDHWSDHQLRTVRPSPSRPAKIQH